MRGATADDARAGLGRRLYIGELSSDMYGYATVNVKRKGRLSKGRLIMNGSMRDKSMFRNVLGCRGTAKTIVVVFAGHEPELSGSRTNMQTSVLFPLQIPKP
jgi:hypothetical protein